MSKWVKSKYDAMASKYDAMVNLNTIVEITLHEDEGKSIYFYSNEYHIKFKFETVQDKNLAIAKIIEFINSPNSNFLQLE